MIYESKLLKFSGKLKNTGNNSNFLHFLTSDSSWLPESGKHMEYGITQLFEELQGRIWYQIKGQLIYYWNMYGVAYPKMGSKWSFGGFYKKSRYKNGQNDI